MVDSYRTASGPRQQVVAWSGKLDKAGRSGVQQAADAAARSDASNSLSVDNRPHSLSGKKRFEFDDEASAGQSWGVEVDASGVRVENLRQFGGPWIALHLIRTLRRDAYQQNAIPDGRERVGRNLNSMIVVIARLLEPSSELFTAERMVSQDCIARSVGCQ